MMLSKDKGWWREPWRLSLLFAVLIPFFSDFSTPVWAVACLLYTSWAALAAS